MENEDITPKELSWEASEYIHHHKPAGWYTAFGLITVALGALLYIVLQDYLTIAVVVLMAVAILVYGVRKPNTLRYSITADGLKIDEKEYSFDRFKSFSIIEDGGLHSINLDPLHRFAPPLTIYFAPEDEQKVTELLGEYLPQNQKEPDIIDRLTRYLRF